MNKQDTSQRNFDNSYIPSMDELQDAWEFLRAHRHSDGVSYRKFWTYKSKAEFKRAIAAHDAKLREQIAQEILDERPPATTEPSLREYITWLRSGHVMSAVIARGKAQEQ